MSIRTKTAKDIIATLEATNHALINAFAHDDGSVNLDAVLRDHHCYHMSLYADLRDLLGLEPGDCPLYA